MKQIQIPSRPGWRARLSLLKDLVEAVNKVSNMKIARGDAFDVPTVKHSESDIVIILPNYEERIRRLEGRVSELE